LKKKPEPIIEFIPIKDVTRMPDTSCPECGRALSAATHMESAAMPSPGDVSICLYCGEFLEYDVLLHTVRLSDKVRQDLIEKQPEEWEYMLEMQRKFRGSAEKFVIPPAERKVQ
jgi:hypothetical protein